MDHQRDSELAFSLDRAGRCRAKLIPKLITPRLRGSKVTPKVTTPGRGAHRRKSRRTVNRVNRLSPSQAIATREMGISFGGFGGYWVLPPVGRPPWLTVPMLPNNSSKKLFSWPSVGVLPFIGLSEATISSPVCSTATTLPAWSKRT